MTTATGHGAPSRKRRRQAVVCTECRRRKIACDRSAPCTQCLNSNLPCTYYNSYSNGGGDMSGGEYFHLPTSRPHVPVSTVPDSGAGHLPTAMSLDTVEAHGWFDAAGLGSIMSLPLSICNETDPLSFTDLTAPGLPRIDTVMPAADTSVMAVKADSVGTSSHGLSNLLGLHKSWSYPPSHWMTLCQKLTAIYLGGDQYGQQGCFDDIISVVFRGGEGHPLLQKCKKLARDLKARTSDLSLRLVSQPLQELMPPRDTADRLVQVYLKIFESVLRVLHVPTFKHEYSQYWTNPHAASDILVIQLLLIMAIGTCFCPDQPSSSKGKLDSGPTLHEQSAQWILAAHMRLCVPLRKAHLSFRGVQAQCLLVIALLTNTNAVGGDLFWLTTTTLIQSALAMGLHSAPSKLSVSPFEAEMRRRLWATVLELAVQASLDGGMPPIVPAEQFMSYEMPSNLDDSQIAESMKTLPASQPVSIFTQSSIPAALMKSMPVRLRISERLSQSASDLSYEVARQAGAELTAILRETSDLIDSFATAPSAFEIQLQDLLARRFLLMLHAQFAYKATSDDKYYFSRKVCLECSLLILTPSRGSGWSSNSANENASGEHSQTGCQSSSEYASLQSYGDGLLKHSFLGAAITVCAEFLLQLREDSSPTASSLSRRDLQHAIEDATALTQRRILRGETSAKAHAFLACVLAKTGGSKRRRTSQVTKSHEDQGVADAAKRALEACCGVLEARIGRMAALVSTRTDSGSSAAPFSWTKDLDLVLVEGRAGDKDHRDNGTERWGDGSRSAAHSLDDGSEAWPDRLALIETWPS